MGYSHPPQKLEAGSRTDGRVTTDSNAVRRDQVADDIGVRFSHFRY